MGSDALPCAFGSWLSWLPGLGGKLMGFICLLSALVAIVFVMVIGGD
jgi:hypothetical protein